MFIYYVNVAAIVILSSLLLIYLLKRNNILNTRIVMAVAASSIVISVLFPFVFISFYDNMDGFAAAGSKMVLALLATFLVHITLILFFTILISFIITDDFDKKIRKLFGTSRTKHKGIDVEKLVQREETAAASEHDRISDSGNEPAENLTSVEPEKLVTETEGAQTAAITAEELPAENISEKLVDSEQNIDKMGLDIIAYTEQNEAESVEVPANEGEVIDLSLEACIDEAFRLKETGDSEGAILYYMYALDRNPENKLVFWIILDICVLYKTLGQQELAKEILESYASAFSAVMDDVVRLEIEKNLQYI